MPAPRKSARRPSRRKVAPRSLSKRKNAKSGINKMRTFLLTTNKLLGDVNAVHKGTIGNRVVRRLAGKEASKGLGSNIFKVQK